MGIGNKKIKIAAVNLKKSFVDSENKKVLALDNFNLEIKEKEFAVIVGPSGCGKSTFLYMVGGFDQPTSGQVLIQQKPVTKPGPNRGFIFQEYVLFPWLNVLKNVSFGLRNQGFSRKEAEKVAGQYIKMVGLEGFERSYPHTLSGGMKQRVAIARALAYDPEILLLDEPFASLDAQTRKIMQQELVRIWQKTKKTVVFVTHSVVEAAYLADRIFVMTARPGKIKAVIEVNIPRPRDYSGKKYLTIRKRALSLLDQEVKKERKLDKNY